MYTYSFLKKYEVALNSAFALMLSGGEQGVNRSGATPSRAPCIPHTDSALLSKMRRLK